MRDLYSKLRIFQKIQQGSIVNGCVAEDYPSSEARGIIITPRCDIENRKVPTIHYLPVVDFEDWLSVDFIKIFAERMQSDLKGKLKNSLKANNISTNISFERLKKNDICQIISSMSQKDYDRFLKIYDEYISLNRKTSIDELYKKYPKPFCNIIKEIKENKNSNFYIIEHWENKEKYLIILLRDVRRITFLLAEKMAKGIYEYELNLEDWIKNDLKKKNDNDNFFLIEAQMNSPYIEHLLQIFFHNFGRIGVNDMEIDINTLLDNSLKI